MLKKKPVISNTDRFFSFNSTVSYTYQWCSWTPRNWWNRTVAGRLDFHSKTKWIFHIQICIIIKLSHGLYLLRRNLQFRICPIKNNIKELGNKMSDCIPRHFILEQAITKNYERQRTFSYSKEWYLIFSTESIRWYTLYFNTKTKPAIK